MNDSATVSDARVEHARTEVKRSGFVDSMTGEVMWSGSVTFEIVNTTRSKVVAAVARAVETLSSSELDD